jgi:peptidoglycan/LPS O-acetylase OafA/YrhL
VTLAPTRDDARPDAAAVPLHRRRYVPAFDGLRAVLVGGVLAYHLSGARLASATGEVAVICFFALSGFLITFLLMDEHRERGRIAIGAFFRRRAARLFPALGLLLGVWAVVALAYRHAPWVTAVPGGGAGGPISVPTIAETVGAGVLYVTNWLNAFVRMNLWTGYSPLGHLWSLAVEEQFYLVWGPAMVLLCRRRHGGWWITALALGFLVEPVWLYHQGTNRVYFGTDTRMGALLVGAALGWWWRAGRLRLLERPVLGGALGAVSAAALLVAGVGFRHPDVAWQWVGGMLLAALASGGVVVHLATHIEVRGAARVLARPTMVWLGRRSYAIYLWGYVFNTWFRSLGAACLPLVLVCTLATAECSYRFVEQPLRDVIRRRRAAARPRRPAPVPPVATLLSVAPAPAAELVGAEG